MNARGSGTGSRKLGGVLLLGGTLGLLWFKASTAWFFHLLLF